MEVGRRLLLPTDYLFLKKVKKKKKERKKSDYMTAVFVDSTVAHGLTRGMEEGRRRENSFGIKAERRKIMICLI